MGLSRKGTPPARQTKQRPPLRLRIIQGEKSIPMEPQTGLSRKGAPPTRQTKQRPPLRLRIIWGEIDTNGTTDETEEEQDNLFAPTAENFQLWIDRADYENGDVLYVMNGVDEDQDEIFYDLISENIDLMEMAYQCLK